MAVLREALARGASPPEAIFRAIADAARVLTGANGTAIALRVGEVVLCRARSGDIAPELGAELSVDSGISGECFRTSTVLRCDDTQGDSRVEPEVCQLLGIRSMVAVPLRGATEADGILEAFSREPHAFGGEQIKLLNELGEIAEVAYRRQFAVTDATLLAPALKFADPKLPFAPAARPDRISTATSGETAPKYKHRYWILSGSVAMLLLASAVVWWTWHEDAGENAVSQPAAQSHTAPVQTAEPSALRVFPLEPPPTAAGQLDQSRPKVVLQNAAKVEATEDRNGSAPANPASAAKKGIRHIDLAAPAASPLRSVDSPSPVDPPPIVAATGNLGDRLSLGSAPARLPEVDIKVSHGVTEGKIVRQVEPVYPRQALIRQLSGSVILQASIAEDGTVRDVKVIRGDPILAAAAVEAAWQWRYDPLLLNGKPISVRKEITFIFKSP